ncbi:epithelial cell-transforming sequence 2 oncogene-like [Chanos chanos]|uniref:Epithelial cell-transforming sequence 2 oncogene-like n=1 Tax=Chanos chanos TaxID=29144 RepID=A0A6J2WFE9_CHACN|nr:epithelial cell-transforming sequence 2 oncogene-like [Chanos chanos]
MTSEELTVITPRGHLSLHSVKRWQLNGTDYQPAEVDGNWTSVTDTRFSAWTPTSNKRLNQQLFQERTTLIFHWFDLWTDHQRKQFIQILLTRCSKSQLRFTRDWLLETVPVTRVDFTAVLPRFLSLYILSFLNPLQLCTAAQVSWHWKFLAEQDCLWSPKCVKRGWFLPYSPSDSEYGAWKRHYVACVSKLDYLTPREASDIYGTLNETVTDVEEEEEERRREHTIRRTIREKLVEHKRAAVKSRRAWLSNSWSAGTLSSAVSKQNQMSGMSLTSAMVHLGDRCRSQFALSLNQEKDRVLSSSQNSTLGRSWVSSLKKSLTLGPHVKQPSSSSPLYTPPLLLLLLSSRIPARELVLGGTRATALPLLYDYDGTTLEALLSLAETALQGRMAARLGILALGGTDHIDLLEGVRVTEQTVLKPRVREFFERLCGWVVSDTDGGRLDVFVPLAASNAGMQLLGTLSSLTGLSVSAPTGISTGSYQHILSDWLGPGAFPPLAYLSEEVLLSWCKQAEWIEEALCVLREQLEPQLHLLNKETRGRTLGFFLWDNIKLLGVNIRSEVTQILIEGLVTLSEEMHENALEFLTDFLRRKCEEDGGKRLDTVFITESGTKRVLSPIPESPQGMLSDADRRTAVGRELLNSEMSYVRLLRALSGVYYTPLRASLDSNRAILSSANLLVVFSSVLDILEINRLFLQELAERLEDWGPLQCLGDVCVKFCTNLRAYTNFFNNYPTILKTIDKVKDRKGLIPAFRTFLKRHDRTLATRMLSLQELLLVPSSRIEEYVTLLQALSLHTPPEHPDHAHITSALHTLLSYRSYIRKLKKSSDHEMRILETQKKIQSCPNLREGSRYLISTQDVALLHCPDEDISPSLRMYEHTRDLGLFLFNDALVLSERSVCHLPFSLAVNSSHTFLASVALHSLAVDDINDTKYVQNAFILEGPSRRWICATDRREEKVRWLSALQRAINSAIAQG